MSPTKTLASSTWVSTPASTSLFGRSLAVGGVIYDVPRSIGVSDYNSSDGTYVTYKTGTEAASSLTADASLSVRYLAVSASASISYALDKSYKREDQWAMYSFNADTYLASMRNYVDLLAETRLKNRLEDMKPINGNDKNSVEEWKEFFSSWGSHVITNARFGARFQLVSRTAFTTCSLRAII